jgi:hypothetical protein
MPAEEVTGSAEPFDLDAEFSAIVSGISGEMHWDATADDLDAAASHPLAGPPAALPERPALPVPPVTAAPPGPDTADDRRRRRQLRRWEREAELEAFQEEKAAVEAERAADTEHFVPPPPPPLPRPTGRTIGAVLLIVAGIVVLAWPRLLAVTGEVTLVLALLLIVSGLGLLLFGLRRRHGDPGDGWDDGAVV